MDQNAMGLGCNIMENIEVISENHVCPVIP